jgi:hypothetical protein
MSLQTSGLVFAWDDAPMVGRLAILGRYLREQAGVELCFAVPTEAGRLRFLREGFQAVTLCELAWRARGQKPADLTADELAGMTWLDRIKRWRWLLEPLADQRWRGDDDSFLAAAAGRLTAGYRLAIEQLRPAFVLVHNGNLGVTSAGLVHAASQASLPVFYFERGLLPDTLVIDPQGVNFGSHVAGDGWAGTASHGPTAEQRQAVETFCQQLIASRTSVVQSGRHAEKAEIRRQLGIEPGQRVILLPLQLEWDSNIQLYSPRYKTMAALISDLRDALGERPDTVLIVRPHPEGSNTDDLREQFQGGPIRFSSEFDLHAMLDLADALVVINSTVGLEAMLHDKPVVLVGEAIYGHKGMTLDLADRTELPARLGEALELGRCSDRNTMLDFLHYLLTRCLFRLEGQDPWDSRATIAAMLADAARQGPGFQASRHEDFFESINGWLVELLRQETPPGRRAMSFGSVPPGLAEVLQAAGVRLGRFRLRRPAGLFALPWRRYDYLFWSPHLPGVHRVIRRLVRARVQRPLVRQ